MPNVMKQLIEGRGPLARLQKFLNYVKLSKRENVASHNSSHWNFKGWFFRENFQFA